MHVAVGDVTPHRQVDTPLREETPAVFIISPKRSNGTITVAGRFVNPAVGLFGERDAAVDAGGRRLSELDQRGAAAAVAG